MSPESCLATVPQLSPNSMQRLTLARRRKSWDGLANVPLLSNEVLVKSSGAAPKMRQQPEVRVLSVCVCITRRTAARLSSSAAAIPL
jgi:hypothetical protein